MSALSDPPRAVACRGVGWRAGEPAQRRRRHGGGSERRVDQEPPSLHVGPPQGGRDGYGVRPRGRAGAGQGRPGRSLGVMPSSVSGTGRPRASPGRSAISSGTGGRGCSPASHRSTEVWSQRTLRHTPRLGQVNDPARQALVGHSGLVHQGPQPQIRRSWPLRHLPCPFPPAVDTVSLTFPQRSGPGRAGFTHPVHTSAPAANLPLPAASVVRCWSCRGRYKRPVWRHNYAKPLVTWRVSPPAAPRRKRASQDRLDGAESVAEDAMPGPRCGDGHAQAPAPLLAAQPGPDMADLWPLQNFLELGPLASADTPRPAGASGNCCRESNLTDSAKPPNSWYRNCSPMPCTRPASWDSWLLCGYGCCRTSGAC